MITANIKRNVPITTKLEVRKGAGPMTFAAGQKPPRKRAKAMNWPPELEGLKAPGLRFQTADGAEVKPVDSEGTPLRASHQNGEVVYAKSETQTDADGKVTTLWHMVPADEVEYMDAEGAHWTADGVQELADYDYLQITGTSEELTKLYSAIQRFSKATGKGVIVRHESETTDERGNTLTQTKNVIRIR